MSLFIRIVVAILLILLAISIGFLILVCWVLAICAGRRDRYLEDDYLVK